jgi:hypothetical protein
MIFQGYVDAEKDALFWVNLFMVVRKIPVSRPILRKVAFIIVKRVHVHLVMKYK